VHQSAQAFECDDFPRVPDVVVLEFVQQGFETALGADAVLGRVVGLSVQLGVQGPRLFHLGGEAGLGLTGRFRGTFQIVLGPHGRDRRMVLVVVAYAQSAQTGWASPACGGTALA
jgi:hypothetical protein